MQEEDDIGGRTHKWKRDPEAIAIKQAFGERFTCLMRDRDLSARRLSNIMGVSHSTVGTWCHGRQMPESIAHMVRIAAALGITLGELLGPEILSMGAKRKAPKAEQTDAGQAEDTGDKVVSKD